MSDTDAQKPSSVAGWEGVIRAIQQPISIYGLLVLVVHSLFPIVLIWAKLPPEKVWNAFCILAGILGGLIMIVTLLVLWKPQSLTYSQDSHLKDKIIDRYPPAQPTLEVVIPGVSSEEDTTLVRTKTETIAGFLKKFLHEARPGKEAEDAEERRLENE